MFSFWNVDSNGNYLSNLVADATGSSPTVMSLETTFHQDLNGDGVIGAAAAVAAVASQSLYHEVHATDAPDSVFHGLQDGGFIIH